VQFERMLCWEAVDANDPMTVAAAKIYEETLAPNERIPWEWIERSLMSREQSRPASRRRHLLLAAPEGRESDPAALAGYSYGSFIPGYGGYLCYMAVAEWARRHGVGSRLMEQFFRQMAVDAGAIGEPLPFVIWESHRPDATSPDADWKLWHARLKLFDRVGGLWLDGVNFLSPSWSGDDTAAVPLQLFVKPMDEPTAALDAERLRQIVGGLHERIYRNNPGDALYDATLPVGCTPRLRPTKAAGRGVSDRELLAAS
jgi:GNAT superfamily N-acetyltransferase